MGIYTIRTPDGKTIKVEGPDGATDEEIIGFARDQMKRGKFANSPVAINRTGATAKPVADLKSTVMQGGTLGFSDEIMGGVGALTDAIASPFSDRIDFNPVASYEAWRDQERARVAETRKQYPWAAPITELGGGLLTGGLAQARGLLQGAGVSAQRTLGGLFQSAVDGAKAAVPWGVAGGFGYGEGLSNSIAGAGLGGAVGAGLGGALPLAFNAVAKPVTTAVNYLRPENGIGRELFVKAARDDGLTPRMIGERIQGASERGVPLAPADLGENLRGLTGGVSRQPGPARRLVRGMLNGRQAEQGERIRGAVTRDLGPIDNIGDASERLISGARAAAQPLYDEAYALPSRTSETLEQVLQTPAGRQALVRAKTIAENERRDPNVLGFGLNDQGEVMLTSAPGAQTLDYIKRGLDDLLEPQRNPVTRRLELDQSGRAVDSVRKDLIREADALYPQYGQARAAFADPARQATALQQGGKMVNATAEEVERATMGLTPAERAQYALGYRSQLAEGLERRVTAGDKVGALIGTPRKQRALGQLFGDEAGFENFGNTLSDEALANETFRSVMTGSPTSNRLADDAAVSDVSLIEDLGGKVLKGGANGGVTGAIAETLSAIRGISKFGAGATGQRAREDAAALLTEVDPVLLGESLSAGLRQQALRRISDRTVRRRVRNAGMFGSRVAGGVSAYGLRPIDD